MKNLLAIDTQINLKPVTGIGQTVSGYTVGGILVAVVNLILVGAALIFFIMLVLGGITWILSGGDKAQTEAARNRITAALIGLVIVFAAYAIAVLAGNFFGFNIFQLTIPGITAG